MLFAGQRLEVGRGRAEQFHQVNGGKVHRHFSGVELGNVEQVGDVLEQGARVAVHDFKSASLLLGQAAASQNFFRRTQDQSQRRAQFMANVGKELRLELVEFLEPGVERFQFPVGRFEPLFSLFGKLGVLNHRQHFGNQWRQGERGCQGGSGRDQLDVAGQPIARLPERPNLHEMSAAAGNNEQAEAQDHPVERYLPAPLVDEVGQRRGNRNVRKSNQHIGTDMQPHHFRAPEIAVSVGQETLRGKQFPPKLRRNEGRSSGHSQQRQSEAERI